MPLFKPVQVACLAIASKRIATRERKAELSAQAQLLDARIAHRLPVIALVGRPNVGKSTLFNRLTRTRDAIVADVPGLTRDRHYGRGRVGSRDLIVIDTGGFEPVAKVGISAEMAKQTRLAVIEADIVIFVVDARDGRTPHDEAIASELRKANASLIVAVNKAEGLPREQTLADFHALGLGQLAAISAAHGDGIKDLIDAALEPFDKTLMQEAQAAEQEQAQRVAAAQDSFDDTDDEDSSKRAIRVAVVGRPNVGKSTLINCLLGENRLVAFDEPGTTRDSIEVDFLRQGRPYVLVDTAGIRRRGKVTDTVEKFSVIKTLQSIDDCHVAILMLDASDGVSDQDANIAGYILESGRAVVVALNKWDAAPIGERERIKADFARRLQFLKFANLHFISAKQVSGISALMKSVDSAFAAAMSKLSTPKLTRAVMDAIQKQAPPRSGFSRPKLRYAHQGGQNPPVVIIHGNALTDVKQVYTRYLETFLRGRFELTGTPLRIEYRSSHNPYVEKDD
jgi:GTPase